MINFTDENLPVKYCLEFGSPKGSYLIRANEIVVHSNSGKKVVCCLLDSFFSFGEAK